MLVELDKNADSILIESGLVRETFVVEVPDDLFEDKAGANYMFQTLVEIARERGELWAAPADWSIFPEVSSSVTKYRVTRTRNLSITKEE